LLVLEHKTSCLWQATPVMARVSMAHECQSQIRPVTKRDQRSDACHDTRRLFGVYSAPSHHCTCSLCWTHLCGQRAVTITVTVTATVTVTTPSPSSSSSSSAILISHVRGRSWLVRERDHHSFILPHPSTSSLSSSCIANSRLRASRF